MARLALLLVCLALAACESPEPTRGVRSLADAVASADTLVFDVDDAEPLAEPDADTSAAPEADVKPLAETPPEAPVPRVAPEPTRRAPEARAAPEANRVPKARPQAPPRDGRYALLVGISDYPGRDDDLPSGGHDVEAMRELLVGHFGYRPENVRVLTDSRATRSAIRRAVRDHLGRADASAVLYFSGHGVRLDGNAGRADDEADGRDEAIYVWADDGRSGSLLLDDEIGAWTDALGARRVAVILDACHSGTGARGEIPGRPLAKEVAYKDIAGTLDEAAPWAQTSRASGARGGSQTVVLGASRDDEQALAGLDGDPSLFTQMLTRVLGTIPPDTPLATAMARVRSNVRTVSSNYGAEHTPQLQDASGVTLADLFSSDR